MARILVIAHDQVGSMMAAPGIRSAEMSRELAVAGHAVTLAIPNEPDIAVEGVMQIADEAATVQQMIGQSDIVITGGGPLAPPFVEVPSHIPHVVDMSFPIILETLSIGGDQPPGSEAALVQERHLSETMRARLLSADLILCASRQQWQFYVGCLAMVGRLTFANTRVDPTLRRLLAVVPFGCPSAPPFISGPGVRGRVSGVDAGDLVLIWSGNISDWYDPDTVVRAVAEVAGDMSRLRLIFLGARPHAGRFEETRRSAQARSTAEQLGLVGSHVFFIDEWVPYESRASWLVDVDAAVVAAPQTLESALSVRARFLDYVWTATPVLTTRGGTLSDAVERERFGVVVEPEDVGAMAVGLRQIADPEMRDMFRRNLELRREEFTWTRAVEPLLAYCAQPHLSRDRRTGTPFAIPA